MSLHSSYEAQERYKDYTNHHRFCIKGCIYLLQPKIQTINHLQSWITKDQIHLLSPIKSICLELPTSICIHPFFNVSLIEAYHKPNIYGKIVLPLSLCLIDVDHEMKYEVEEILKSHI